MTHNLISLSVTQNPELWSVGLIFFCLCPLLSLKWNRQFNPRCCNEDWPVPKRDSPISWAWTATHITFRCCIFKYQYVENVENLHNHHCKRWVSLPLRELLPDCLKSQRIIILYFGQNYAYMWCRQVHFHNTSMMAKKKCMMATQTFQHGCHLLTLSQISPIHFCLFSVKVKC